MRVSIIGSPIYSVGNTHNFNRIMWNKESRNDIKSLVWCDERKFIHVHCVSVPFVILQTSQNGVLLPAVHGRLQAVGIGGT